MRYIRYTLQSPGTAMKMLDTLEQEIASLSCFPNRVPLTDEEPWHSRGVHKMLVKSYLVYFWIDEDAKLVHVIAVIYARKNQRDQLVDMNI